MFSMRNIFDAWIQASHRVSYVEGNDVGFNTMSETRQHCPLFSFQL